MTAQSDGFGKLFQTKVGDSGIDPASKVGQLDSTLDSAGKVQAQSLAAGALTDAKVASSTWLARDLDVTRMLVTPRSYAQHLAAWWDSSPLAVGAPASMADLSYQGNDATFAGSMTVTRTGSPNGMPVMLPAAGKYATVGASILPGVGWDAYLVLKAAPTFGLLKFAATFGTPPGWGVGTDGLNRMVRASSAGTAYDFGAATTNWEVWRVTVDAAGNLSSYVNGVLAAGPTPVTELASVGAATVIGAYSNLSLSWASPLAEVVVFAGVPLGPDRALALQTSLAAKWGLGGPLVVVDGNSIGAGSGNTAGHDFPILTAAALGADYTVINHSVGGIDTPTQTTNAPAQVDNPYASRLRRGGGTIVVHQEGMNDLYFTTIANGVVADPTGAVSAATCIARTQAYVSARHAAGEVVIGVSPFSRNNAGTLANYEPARQAYLAAFRAGQLGYDVLVDLDTLYPALLNPNDLAVRQSDLVHLLDVAQGWVQAAVTAAVLTVAPRV